MNHPQTNPVLDAGEILLFLDAGLGRYYPILDHFTTILLPISSPPIETQLNATPLPSPPEPGYVEKVGMEKWGEA